MDPLAPAEVRASFGGKVTSTPAGGAPTASHGGHADQALTLCCLPESECVRMSVRSDGVPSGQVGADLQQSVSDGPTAADRSTYRRSGLLTALSAGGL